MTPITDGVDNTYGIYAFVSASSGAYMSAVQTSPGIWPGYATLQLGYVQDYWTITNGTEPGYYVCVF